jgi:hypothetical protein
MTPTYFRNQAEALYNLARKTNDASERLAHVLKAMEFEARAVDAERGKGPPGDLHDPNITGCDGE